VPPPPIRDLRDLVRLRRSLSEALTTEQNRTLKLLESANIKLASVVSEVFGVSGRAMLKALIENTATPQRWRTWPSGSCAASWSPWLWRWMAG
jgi:transposase